MLNRKILSFVIVVSLVIILGSCKDMGTPPPTPPAGPPVLASIFPDSAAVGDTVRITGTNFGSDQSSGSLTIGGRTATSILVWSDTEIRAEVPLLAATDSARVSVNGKSSNGLRFKALTVRYSTSVNPVFQSTCIGCHGGEHNLFLDSYANLMLGTSTNGPAVTPGNGEGSLIIHMLRGVQPGRPRMPFGGPYLRDAAIDKISTWIQQGATNN
ncbi:MAG: IPT/TIG domain-containing protein [Bacteroidota bacterium]